MRHPLLLLCALLLLAVPASAQQWQFDTIFPPDTLETNANAFHGVAVDAEGKVWLQPHNSRLAQVDGAASEALHVYYPDGTEVDFSPLAVIEFADGTTPAVTIGTTLGRGMASDHEGNILASYGSMVIKIDHRTGQGLGMVDIGTPAAAATADAEGNIYVGAVLPGHPIRVYNTNFTFQYNVRDNSPFVARSHVVAPDGLTFYETNADADYVIIHQREDEFAAFDSVGVAFVGMRPETAAINPATGHLWIASGNPSDDGLPNRLPNPERPTAPEPERFWLSNTWYVFSPDNLSVPVDSVRWGGCTRWITTQEEYNALPEVERAAERIGGCIIEGVARAQRARPRGMAFTPDGNTLYLASFNAAPTAPGSNLQRWTLEGVSNEPGAGREAFVLRQNYPNPFQVSTQISFTLEQPGHVSLKVYDVLGRQVAVLVDEALDADTHTATLRADGLAAGTYLYVLSQDGQRLGSHRLQVVK